MRNAEKLTLRRVTCAYSRPTLSPPTFASPPSTCSRLAAILSPVDVVLDHNVDHTFRLSFLSLCLWASSHACCTQPEARLDHPQIPTSTPVRVSAGIPFVRGSLFPSANCTVSSSRDNRCGRNASQDQCRLLSSRTPISGSTTDSARRVYGCRLVGSMQGRSLLKVRMAELHLTSPVRRLRCRLASANLHTLGYHSGRFTYVFISATTSLSPC
ncbi:uncharacterized protein LAESUDRAFT_527953 [Laetiporus sulphureus 93-53]|uniref:Uncharacterized protein n=1 Tax=Laetiporus sulphureus 93-53 TaxID=1314785 RepID=A0A165BCN1_9APHY|nr:uncharacterized protein LAESUDRAFT_527953 [Laetiporus sulphureus 93-53]KZT00748.1 hypothetical protein LAESUDRAFT_527953 [Laetiporus sulphureus 93-53]